MGFFNGSDIQKLSNVAAGSYNMTLRGGNYWIETVSTGTGTINLQRLSPDQSYRSGMITTISATAGQQTVSLAPGMYQVVISGFTANYVDVTRIPIAIE